MSHDLTLNPRLTSSRIIALGGLLPSGLLAAGVALAQVPAGSGTSTSAVLEEVVVTARKREESLLEVPLSVTAFSAEAIQEAGIYDMRDLSALTPGLNFKESVSNTFSGRQSGSITIRGMSPGTALARDQTGSVFVDGVFVANGIGSINTIDLERVEVLRGPQNTYFGRSTFGGAVNFITRTPSDTFGLRMDGEATTRDSYRLGLSLEGPLIGDTLKGRVTGLINQKGAQYRAADGGDLGEEGTDSITATLLFTPTDALSVRLRAHYQEDEDGPSSSAYLRGLQFGALCPGQRFPGQTAAGADTTFTVTLPYFCGSVPSLGDLPSTVVSSNTTMRPSVLERIGRPDYLIEIAGNNALNSVVARDVPALDHVGFIRNATRLSLQSDYEFAAGITLSANFAYNDDASLLLSDVDRTDQQNAFSLVASTFTDRSAELRLTSGQDQRLRWLVGANYLEIDSAIQQFGYQIAPLPNLPPPAAGFVNAASPDDAEVTAGFAALEFDLFDAITVAAEARFQQDKSTIVGPTGPTSVTFEDWMPRAIAQFRPREGMNVYASWSKGVASGRLNGGYTTATPAQQTEIRAIYPNASSIAPLPEVEAYEIGVKQSLMGGRLQYSVAIYDMDWTSINTTVSVPVSTTPFIIGIVAPNDAELRGVEVEARAAVTDRFSLAATLNWQDNKYTNLVSPLVGRLTGGVTRFDGNEVPRNPELAGSLTALYRARFGSGDWSWFTRGDVSYTGKAWESEANIAQFDAFTRVNARLGIEKEDVTVELFVRNLFDDENWDYGFRSTSVSEPGSLLFVPFGGANTLVQGLIVQPPDRRELGLRVSYQF